PRAALVGVQGGMAFEDIDQLVLLRVGVAQRRDRARRETCQVDAEVGEAEDVAQRALQPARHARGERFGVARRPSPRRDIGRDDGDGIGLAGHAVLVLGQDRKPNALQRPATLRLCFCHTRKRHTCVLPEALMIALLSSPARRCCRRATRPCFTASSFEMATPFPSRPSRRKKKSSAYGPSSVVRISTRSSSSHSTPSSRFFPIRGPNRLDTPRSVTSISSTKPLAPGSRSARKPTTQNAPAHHGMPPCTAKAKLSAANTANPMSARRLRERILLVTGCARALAARIAERAELELLRAARAHHFDQLDERV